MLCVALAAVLASIIAGSTAPLPGAPHVTLLVKFRSSVEPAARRAELLAAGARPLSSIPAIGVSVASVPTGSARRTLAALGRSPDVLYAERNGRAKVEFAPNDPYFVSGNPGCQEIGCWPYAELHLPEAWDVTTGSSAVTVAVLDTGVEGQHPDLAGAVLPGYNFFDGNGDTSDTYGHGTEVAGVIAARSNNGIGVPGVCGHCMILPVRIGGGPDGSATDVTMAQGIDYAADHGARVINMSYGGPAQSQSVADAIRYAVAKGALVVVSAGNAGSSDPTFCPDPAKHACGGYPAASAPELGAGLISVGGLDAPGRLASWSNHGSWVLVAAPGVTFTTRYTGDWGVVEGTSFAAPYVAGVAALLLSQNPQLDVAGLQRAITSTVTRVPGLDVADGTVNAFAALKSVGTPGYATPQPNVNMPDTSVALTGMSRASPVGGQVQLSVTVGDQPGAGPAKAVQLTVGFGRALKFRRASGATCTAGAHATIDCAVGDLAQGETRKLTIVATVSRPGPQTISASVSHTATDANPADDAAASTFRPATRKR